MKSIIVASILLLLPVISFGQEVIKLDKDKTQNIYISNEIPTEILRAYNEQAALISDMRLKIQALEQQLFQATERVANLEAEVWEMAANQKIKAD